MISTRPSTAVAAAACVLFIPLDSPAQEAPPPDPQPPALAVEAENLGDTLMESAPVAPALDAAEPAGQPEMMIPSAEVEPRRGGRWQVAPHAVVKATYDDNIFIQSENEVDDFIFTLAPGIALGFWDNEKRLESFLDRDSSAHIVEKDRGNFLLFDYTAIFLGFAKTTSQNAFDQDVLFDAHWEGEKLSLGARVHFESRSEANIDIGGRVRRNTVTTGITSSYQLTEKTALEVNFYNIWNEPEDFVRTIEWKNENYLSYAVSPLLRVGFGLALGRVEVEGGADEDFEQILARAVYSFTEKLEFEARGGVEFRQSDGQAGDRTNPVFELGAIYYPVAGTRLGLEGFRRVETSAFRPEQDVIATGVEVSLRRVIRGGLHFSVHSGYRNSDYTDFSGEEGRSDDYFFVRPAVLYNFAHWGNAELSYEFRKNDSSRASSSFRNQQTAIQVSVLY